MIFAAVLAGGSGTRMGAAMPKQFLEIDGVPIIVRSVLAFAECKHAFDRIYVASAPAYSELARNLLQKAGLCSVEVIDGGTDRTGSILNVISAILASGGSRDDILITHDAARPFVLPEVIRQNIDDTLCFGCAGTAITATDTVFRSSDGQAVSSMPPRSEMFQMQTPQGFAIGGFLECLSSLTPEERDTITDACGVFLRAGRRVHITPGTPENIKITRPVDLAAGEFIARQISGREKSD